MSGIEVVPQPCGRRVQPRDPAAPRHAARAAAASSVVRARLGEWVELGGIGARSRATTAASARRAAHRDDRAASGSRSTRCRTESRARAGVRRRAARSPRAVGGFKLRPQQLEMAQAIHDAIERTGVLVAEAGTGTGKTFAYLVPALLAGGKVIVSTGTKTLQDQLFDRDLPAVREALAGGASAALLKGRANYVCLYRLRARARTMAAFASPGRCATADAHRALRRGHHDRRPRRSAPTCRRTRRSGRTPPRRATTASARPARTTTTAS